MSQYAYRAMDAGGRVRRGRLRAAHEEDLETRLAQLGLDLISCRPAAERLALRRNLARGDLIHFCFQLQQLLHAGIPLPQALREIREGVEHPTLKDIALALTESVEHGQPLSAAMAQHPRTFDRVLVALVGVGEQTGRLSEALADVTEMLRWQHGLATRIAQVLLYPLLVAVMMAGVLVFLMGHVVPQLASFITSLEGELPLATRALLVASSAVGVHGPWLLALALAGAFALLLQARRDPRWQQRLAAWSLHLWLVGPIRRHAMLSRVARVIGLMYRAGVPMLEILAVAASVAGNRAVAQALAEVRAEVLAGAPLARAFQASALFPRLVVRMVSIGESTGSLDTAMFNVSQWYEYEVKLRVERLERALEPAITLVLGLLLGWMVLAVLGPIYDLVGTIR